MKSKLSEFLKNKSLVGILINLGVIIVVFILVVILFFYAYLPSITNQGESVTVPRLEGMSLQEMESFLGKRNLRFEVMDSVFTSKNPPLTIIKQYPLPNAKVKENRKIYLTVEANEPTQVKMPNLIDGSLKNAELVLKSYGLVRGDIMYKPDIAANAVLNQLYNGIEIRPGDAIPKGSRVDLVVGDGLGKRVFDVPNYRGLMVDEAEVAIIGNGLRRGSLIVKIMKPTDSLFTSGPDIDSVIMESGRVYKQFPSAGSSIRLGDQVDLWVTCFNKEDSIRLMRGQDLGRVRSNGLDNDY